MGCAPPRAPGTTPRSTATLFSRGSVGERQVTSFSTGYPIHEAPALPDRATQQSRRFDYAWPSTATAACRCVSHLACEPCLFDLNPPRQRHRRRKLYQASDSSLSTFPIDPLCGALLTDCVHQATTPGQPRQAARRTQQQWRTIRCDGRGGIRAVFCSSHLLPDSGRKNFARQAII